MNANAKYSAFLRVAAGRQFEFGTFDCGLWLADYVQQVRGLGFDPAGDYRRRYRSLRQAARICQQAGGYLETVDMCASDCGLVRTNNPKPGDIAILRPVDFGNQLTGAIRGELGWWLLTPDGNRRGVSLASDRQVKVEAAWRV